MTITKNTNYNSYEIAFDAKPDEATREILKASGYRWHKARAIWYGYKDISEKLNGESKAENAPKNALPSLWERTRTEAIPEHSRTLDAVTVAAELRAELKRRFPEVKFSIRSRSYSGGQSVDCYITKSPYGQNIVKGDPSAYDWRYREDRAEDSPALAAVRKFCVALADSYNYDNSDAMTDYFDVNFYGGYFQNAYDIEFIKPSPEILADIADFEKRLEEDEKRKAEQAERERLEYEKAMEEERKRAEQIERENAEKEKAITERAKVFDLPAAFTILSGGIGKEANRAELDESMTEQKHDAIITRIVRLATDDDLTFFENNLLRDWDFLAGFGGTNTDDPRVNDDNYNKLNTEQRATVKFYMDNCVAVYVGDKIKYIVDPEGFGYARYVYILTEQTETMTADEYHERNNAEQKTPFYFPAPIDEQITNIKAGDKITIFQTSSMLIGVSDTRAEVVEVKPEKTAYKGNAARLYIKLPNKRGLYEKYISTSEITIIYRGWLSAVPDDIKYGKTDNQNLFIRRDAGMHYKEYLKDVLKYYGENEILVDTFQR